jgi:glycosyltransferase involved in cell wall biosynthesis
MVIAIFSESFTPIINGVSISIETFAKHLRELGCELYFFAPRYPGYKDKNSAVYRFPSFRFPHHPEYPIPIPFSPRIFEAFSSLRVDIVHPQTPFLLGWTAKYLARKNGAALVTTYHTFYEEYSHYAYPLPSFLIKPFLRKLSRDFCNLCDAVVVPSRAAEKLLRSYGVYRPIEVIPTGLELDSWYGEENPAFPRISLGIPTDAPILTYVGRLAMEKNVQILLFSFRKLLEKIPNVYLLLVGSGPQEEELKKLAEELLIRDKCHFLGFVEREKVRECLAASDVFLFPSKTETQGLVMAEALAMGVPVISADSFGARETIRVGVDGFILPAEPEAFANVVEELLSNREKLNKMKEEALKGAKRFSAKESARKLLALYERLIEKNKSK